MELWELAARERIRDSLARYNWSGDAFRLDELALAFCDDGELEIRGREAARGRHAIVELLGGGSEPGDDEARRTALRKAADAFVPVADEWLIRHRYVSVDWRIPESTMAPPPT